MTEIKRVGVLGCGLMGRGIAQISAQAGFETVARDISDEFTASGKEAIEKSLAKFVEKGKMSADDRKAALARLTMTTDISDLKASDIIVEAVTEDLELKNGMWRELDGLCGPDTIFASNTSSLTIAAMAAVTQRADRFVGLHFFNPVHIMKLVEIVRGLETSEETIAATKGVGEKMGKETVTIKESPGFITSRINAMIGNEAFYMLQEGIATAEEIDKALKLGLNHPMGPFEMVDLVGLDTRLSILKFLHQTLGEKYRPCTLLEQYVRAGRLGRKTGKGVYDYTKK
ncbi:3-hydroxyacyl-CoA dehydrogenase [candidate division KSB1 bacterium]|nr:3-hydroxyacyl-CoA dehydrogenase [candidate division KSB1 bacterium]